MKTMKIQARRIRPGDRVVEHGGQDSTLVREVANVAAHLGGRERVLEFKDGGPVLIVGPDHLLKVEGPNRAVRIGSRGQQTTTKPTAGERFVLIADIDRYPHFVAVRGSSGTVTDVSEDAICLRLDDPLPGAEEWDNEVVWSADEGDDFWAAVERLPS